MTTSHPSQGDQPLVHEYIRRFGRRPSAAELEKFRASQAPDLAVLAKMRHRLAHLITRI
ncbi:hypothetical protein GCM10009798_35250 [Nocardioides panacihumi]|uniref:DUF3263 domain-containing protein n=1 Tax=Nocardioides panacihumi TaxID=400774 RepID=A0ABP5D1X2_9ACTN